jgi:hypothetical protein
VHPLGPALDKLVGLAPLLVLDEFRVEPHGRAYG